MVIIYTADDYAFKQATDNFHIEIAKLLLDNGAKINAGNNHALIWANKCGNLEMVSFLLNNGAKLTNDIIANPHTTLKKFFDNFKINLYYGIKSVEKLDIILPELLEIYKNDSYYYVYEPYHDYDQDEYYVENLINRYQTLLTLNKGIPKYFKL